MEETVMNKNQKGFTLIELLIVIAIIAILAAIAIPQFSAYRIRGYNASAESDLRNTRTAEEALFADYRVYGKSDAIGALPGGGGSGAGNLLTGPLSAATVAVNGALITATITVGGNNQNVGAGFVIGGGNILEADVDPTNATYTITTKGIAGNRVFAGELESSGLYFQQDDNWIGSPTFAACNGLTMPAFTTAPDLIAPWSSM